MFRILSASLVVFFSLYNTAYANNKGIPAELEQWQSWVMFEHKDHECPFLYNKATKVCTWHHQLKLNINNKGASFNQTIETFNASWVPTLGNKDQWPTGVTINGEAAQIRDHKQRPQIFLPAGEHIIEGRIHWDSLPRQLQLPKLTGIVELTLNNKSISQPFIDKQKKLWLSKNSPSQKKSADSAQIKVFRLISDQLPLKMTTQLVLDISGRERELRLGQILPNNFTAISLDSALPSRIEDNGGIRIQIKPGHWVIELHARQTKTSQSITYSAKKPWPQQEIWSFQAQPHLRQVQIEGASTIDPQQTQLPEKWRQLPSYLVTPETQFTLKELHRGDTNPSANRLNIKRDMWLDFDGQEYTLRDSITGTMNRDWRLNAQPSYQLGRVSIHNKPQLITLFNDLQGVEIRQAELDIDAVSRVSRHHPGETQLSASGWKNNIEKLNTTLHLAPGWALIAAEGADYAHGSWLSKWNLWDIFLLLIIGVSIYRLYGALAATCLLFTLVLIYQRDGAPVFIWLNIAAALALVKVTTGAWQTRLKYYSYSSFALLLLIAIPFSVDSVRQAFYPQLEHANRTISAQNNHSMQDAHTLAKVARTADSAPALMEEIQVTGLRGSYISEPKRQQYDPTRNIQTGPGIPDWRWNQISIGWNGPVTPEQTLQLRLTPPWLNRLGHILSVIMIALSALLLFKRGLMASIGQIKTPRNNRTLSSGLIAMIFAIGIASHSDEPQAEVLIDSKLLTELEERLLAPADCLPSCASIESGNIHIDTSTIKIELLIHASEHIALPLPLPTEGWQASKITIDNKVAALIRYNNQQWLTQLQPGRQKLVIHGSLKGVDQLSLPFVLNAHNLTTTSKGWRVEGVRNGSTHNNSVELNRVQASNNANSERLQPGPMPNFVTVTRTITLGLDWKVHTRVSRVSPAKGAIHIKLPLLQGESPTQADFKIHNQYLQASIAANKRYISWNSILANDVSQLQLQAEDQTQWTETWVLNTSPIWHIETSGLAPTKPLQASASHTWQPRPGDSLNIKISRPEALSGNNLSIDQVALKQTLGLRSQLSELDITLRASQGGEFVLPLPENTELRQLNIEGIEQPIINTQGEIKIPLHPGEQHIKAHWSTAEDLSWLSKTPALALGNSSNNSVSISLPRDRWPLLVGGPSIGPAILLWGMLAVVLILSAGLGRLQQTPLKAHHWLLLGIGMGTANVFAPLLITAWLLALGWRGQWQQRPDDSRFSALQIGLVMLSFVAIISLLATIPYGLLASPDMHIVGNSSSAYQLKWYQDLTDGALEQAWVISLPMWSYRLAMLIWSLWMALALVNWLKWGWQQLNHLGFWPEKNQPDLDSKSAKPGKSTELTLDLELPESPKKQ